jgi:hypothetical protein
VKRVDFDRAGWKNYRGLGRGELSHRRVLTKGFTLRLRKLVE